MKSSLRITVFFWVCLCVLPLCGCGNGNVKATGMVAFDDGSPLTTGIVVFKSSQHQYTGLVNQDGSFKLGGINVGDGLPAGQYKVVLQNAIDAQEKPLVNEKFSSTEATPISFEITPETKMPLRIVVERP